jgi:hypothetical protein
LLLLGPGGFRLEVDVVAQRDELAQQGVMVDGLRRGFAVCSRFARVCGVAELPQPRAEVGQDRLDGFVA